MTTEQAIEKIRQIQTHPSLQIREQMLRRLFAKMRWHYTSLARCAARYVQLTGCTQRKASAIFGVSNQTISQALNANKHKCQRNVG